MTIMLIQPLWLTHFIEIILVLDFQVIKFIVGVFSYKALFRPQISSNVYVANCEILNVILIINNCLGYCVQHLYLNAACNRTTLFILQLLLNLICVHEYVHTSQVI